MGGWRSWNGSLSDTELSAVMTAAKPIPAQSRDAFLRDVSIELSRFEVIGPGLVARACSKIQRQYLNAPSFTGNSFAKHGHR